MVLKFKGQFNRDIDINNHEVLQNVYSAISNVKAASSINQIQHLKKLRSYKTYYRIRVADDYRIGVIIRKKTVWFVCFGHRNTVYKYFP